MTAGEKANVEHIEVLHEETKPPARFTESTLLSAMEGAGKLIDDEALAMAAACGATHTVNARRVVVAGRPRWRAAPIRTRRWWKTNRGSPT